MIGPNYDIVQYVDPFLTLKIQEALKAEGFSIERSAEHSIGWIAMRDFPVKSCFMQPGLCVTVSMATVDGVDLRLASFRVSAFIPTTMSLLGSLFSIQVHSVNFNEPADIIAAIPFVTAVALPAWESAYKAARALTDIKVVTN